MLSLVQTATGNTNSPPLASKIEDRLWDFAYRIKFQSPEKAADDLRIAFLMRYIFKAPPPSRSLRDVYQVPVYWECLDKSKRAMQASFQGFKVGVSLPFLLAPWDCRLGHGPAEISSLYGAPLW